MMKGKNALLGALTVVLMVFLTACGGQSQTPATGAAATSVSAAQAPTVAATTAPAATEAPVAATTAPAPAATSASTSGDEIVITHAQGETAVKKNPQTVVVFDYSALDTLDQLGVNIAAVPQGTNIPPFLAKYKEATYANAGTLFEPDYEKVNELKPDLIIVAGRSSSVYPELAKIGPTIDLTIDQEKFLEGFKFNVTTLAAIFGKESEAESKLAAIDESIERVKGQASASGKSALILMTSGGKVTAYGPGSRFGIIHDLLDVAPVADAGSIETATHGDAISFEFIQQENPDILYVVDRDAAIGESGEAAEQVLDNELVQATNASKNGKIIYLDGGAWYLANAGLGSFASMISEVETGLE